MKIIIKEFKELSIDELYEILKIRVDVFVVEQKCPYEEIDGLDKKAIHMYLKQDDQIKAYLRIISEDDVGHIGRVIAVDRRKGYGTLLLEKALEVCTQRLNMGKMEVEAQYYAKDFYEKCGFVKTGEPFELDGIKHIRMIYHKPSLY